MSKGLKALKSLVDEMPFVFIETNSMNYIEMIEKELKALEIIRKWCLVAKYPNNTYELSFSTKVDICKEEYDLLKEVL